MLLSKKTLILESKAVQVMTKASTKTHDLASVPRARHIQYTLEHLRRLKAIADSLPPGTLQRDQLLEETRNYLESVEPVPVSVAAGLLHLSPPTVRKWMDEGVLRRAGKVTPI